MKKYRPYVYADKDAQPRILANLDGDHDPKAHVKTGPIDFLEAGFDERPASLVGAQKVMAERSTGDSKADILDETYAYLPAEGGAGRWSAIRDGNGRRVHIDSISDADLQSKLDATLDELTRLNQERHRRSSATG